MGRFMFHISGLNDFAQEVAGESHYQSHLESVVGGRGRSGAEHTVQAVLVYENSNRHDRNAVRVDVQGGTVGYLPRQDAKPFRKWLASMNVEAPVTCLALIVGGWENSKSSGHFGIRLDMEIGADYPTIIHATRKPAKAKSGCGCVFMIIIITTVVVLAVSLALEAVARRTVPSAPSLPSHLCKNVLNFDDRPCGRRITQDGNDSRHAQI